MSGDEQTVGVPEEETLTRAEIQIEQEKLKLERERMLLERERLEAARERNKIRGALYTDQQGKLRVKLSSVIMISIICSLLGGILGALSTSIHLDRRRNARLHEVMQTLASNQTEVEVATNESVNVAVESKLPTWLQVMSPKKAYTGVSVLVIQ